MICIKVDIPKQICKIDDELKAIYHSNDSICVWVFSSRLDRNNFVDNTVGMSKSQRSKYYEINHSAKLK